MMDGRIVESDGRSWHFIWKNTGMKRCEKNMPEQRQSDYLSNIVGL
jgi:hypothetical protein